MATFQRVFGEKAVDDLLNGIIVHLLRQPVEIYQAPIATTSQLFRLFQNRWHFVFAVKKPTLDTTAQKWEHNSHAIRNESPGCRDH